MMFLANLFPLQYKYGLSLAERPRFRNRDPFVANDLLPFTDGRFIAPPKLGVELPKEHNLTVIFLDNFKYYIALSDQNYLAVHLHFKHL